MWTSDWADAQADLSLHRAHSHLVGFVMRWLKLCSIQINPRHEIMVYSIDLYEVVRRISRCWKEEGLWGTNCLITQFKCFESWDRSIVGDCSDDGEKGKVLKKHDPVEQIRRVFGDNWRIILDNSPKKRMLCGLWKNNENYLSIILKYPPYLFHWSDLPDLPACTDSFESWDHGVLCPWNADRPTKENKEMSVVTSQAVIQDTV